MCNISNFCVQPLQICNVLLLFYQYCNSAASIAMMQAKNIIMKKKHLELICREVKLF